MKSFCKLAFVVLVIGVFAAVVVSIVSKRKIETMTDDEIRDYLKVKLSGKVGDDRLATIQDAVVAGVRGKRSSADHYVQDLEGPLDELADVAEDAAASE